MKIEAENTTRVTLENYEVFDNNSASGSKAVRIEDIETNGIIRIDWTETDGVAGKYHIGIAHFDEIDGQAKLTLRVNGTDVDTYTLDKNLGGDGPNSGNYVGFTDSLSNGDPNPNPIFKDVQLAPGDRIEIVVEADSLDNETFELGRIDAIEFTSAEVDLFWHNSETGTMGAWRMHGVMGTDLDEAVTIQMESVNSDWEIRAAGDFNGDSHKDMVWRNTANGDIGIWLMNGSQFQEAVSIVPVSDLNWKIHGTGDFNRDQQTDLLWRNDSTGENAVWLMNGTEPNRGVLIQSELANSKWKILGAGDFDGDKNADVLWLDTENQNVYYWRMAGTDYIESVFVNNAPLDDTWKFQGVMDFDKNGYDDIFWSNTVDGKTGMWMMNENGYDRPVIAESVDLSWEGHA
ncbi:VCBS repeat-containing protein [Moorena sp. SIO4G3]|uniref:FG-GAP repeat domain-containing protein n=1 Tax=Moorena sp. SIO4G3 TaxID=2607821 RepID=UPI001429E122|nr:VCBS repeat-containing protein [Moorena sp. SIO4G3]NEO81320.1 VCBS repeat-containing protein [Moorena sp. SIO4G3]